MMKRQLYKTAVEEDIELVIQNQDSLLDSILAPQFSRGPHLEQGTITTNRGHLKPQILRRIVNAHRFLAEMERGPTVADPQPIQDINSEHVFGEQGNKTKFRRTTGFI
jgi:hypothetical protein